MDNSYFNQAERFLRSGNILEQLLKDMELLGYIGERENKMLGYLIALSRKLDQPLSGIVVSSSGAGKSKLVETIQRLTPSEDIVFTSRLTPQSLYYIQKDFLRHKLLIVEERQGSELADYALRSLQSKGVLSLAIPVKSQTVFFQVRGPVSVLETTTNYKLNLENTSRCFLLHLDESEKQTAAIHSYQRLIRTRHKLKLKDTISRILNLHQHIQRLIKPQTVIIPYAGKLSFPADYPASRREHQKFLTLIEAVTLLYQYQRKSLRQNGLSYIESTPQDYRVAFELFKRIERNHLLLAHPKAGILLAKIGQIDKELLTRSDIARCLGWAGYQVRDNIRYLEQSGLLEIVRRKKGQKTWYRLNHKLKLTKPEELEESHSSTT